MKRLGKKIKGWIKKKEPALPNKAYQLLQLSYEAVLQCEDEPFVYVITHEYEYNMFHVYAPLLDQTALNYAGALAAKTFDINHRETKKITDFEDKIFVKLLSVDLLSNFEIYQGLELLYRGTDKLDLCMTIEKCFRPEDTLYENSKEYKKVLELLIRLLRSLDL